MDERQRALEDLVVDGFWSGKRVVLTGHTGFKGSWLALWLHRLGAEVTGISLPPRGVPNLFTLAGLESICSHHVCDIRDSAALATVVERAQPEIVFHLAAQPLVRASYHEPVQTFATNVMGTAHVLDALRALDGVRVAVMITTDKVYRDNEGHRPFREEDPLGGHDPYSASKAASELIIASYRDAFLAAQDVAVASARAGNVIGGGDWSADRLIPDAVRAWEVGHVLEVRRPTATRPWQHVLEPLHGYLKLARSLWENPSLAGAFNFGPLPAATTTVGEVIELARTSYGTGEVHLGAGDEGPFEAGWLALDPTKAADLIDVEPRWSLQESIARTMTWYRSQRAGTDARTLCDADITAYEELL